MRTSCPFFAVYCRIGRSASARLRKEHIVHEQLGKERIGGQIEVLRAVGISKTYARRHYDIATMTKYLPKCPDFTVYTAKSFTQSTQHLLPGDILLSSHHTAIVVKSPNAK